MRQDVPRSLLQALDEALASATQPADGLGLELHGAVDHRRQAVIGEAFRVVLVGLRREERLDFALQRVHHPELG